MTSLRVSKVLAPNLASNSEANKDFSSGTIGGNPAFSDISPSFWVATFLTWFNWSNQPAILLTPSTVWPVCNLYNWPVLAAAVAIVSILVLILYRGCKLVVMCLTKLIPPFSPASLDICSSANLSGEPWAAISRINLTFSDPAGKVDTFSCKLLVNPLTAAFLICLNSSSKTACKPIWLTIRFIMACLSIFKSATSKSGSNLLSSFLSSSVETAPNLNLTSLVIWSLKSANSLNWSLNSSIAAIIFSEPVVLPTLAIIFWPTASTPACFTSIPFWITKRIISFTLVANSWTGLPPKAILSLGKAFKNSDEGCAPWPVPANPLPNPVSISETLAILLTPSTVWPVCNLYNWPVIASEYFFSHNCLRTNSSARPVILRSNSLEALVSVGIPVVPPILVV